MLGFSILKTVFDSVIRTKLVKQIHHSVQLRPIEGNIKPAAPVDNGFIYVGIDDLKGFSTYCRPFGSLEVLKAENIGSANSRLYTTQIPHRLVFYHASEDRNHDELLGKLIKAVISNQWVKLQKVHTNTDVILQSEAPTGKFTFRPNTFYAAIDFYIILRLQSDNCETEFTCKGVKNPYC
jgi:hypothetical protein